MLADLADVDTGGDDASLILEKLGPETRGLIAMPVDLRRPDLDRLKDLNKQFEQGL